MILLGNKRREYSITSSITRALRSDIKGKGIGSSHDDVPILLHSFPPHICLGFFFARGFSGNVIPLSTWLDAETYRS